MSEVEIRKSMKVNSCVLALIILFIALVATGCGGKTAVLVNGESISWDEYEREYSRRISTIKRESPKDLEGEIGQDLREETKRQVATDLIRDKLVGEKAGDLGVEVNRAELEGRLRSERRRLGEEGFSSMLAESGLTEREYVERLSQEMLVDALGEAVTSGISVNEEEAEAYFLEYRERFSQDETIRLAHILVGTEGQAKVIADEARRGKDWGYLARDFSEDVITRDDQGDMGWVTRGTIDPVLEKPAFTLQVGEVGGPIQASDGYHVIRVLERKEAHNPAFDEVKKEARKELLREKKEEKFQRALKALFADAKVALEIGNGHWDPNLGMVVKNKDD